MAINDWNKIRTQKLTERETEGYKALMRVAKKIKAIDYDSKWQINIDPVDPLRKFTLDRDIGWATLSICLTMKESYHRGTYDYDQRVEFIPLIAFKGLFEDSKNKMGVLIETGIRVRPRMAKKLIKCVNEVIIPRFYKEIEDERARWEHEHIVRKQFRDNIAKIPKLLVKKEMWSSNYKGEFPVSPLACPFDITCKENTVGLNGEMSYDEFKELVMKMGYGQ